MPRELTLQGIFHGTCHTLHNRTGCVSLPLGSLTWRHRSPFVLYIAALRPTCLSVVVGRQAARLYTAISWPWHGLKPMTRRCDKTLRRKLNEALPFGVSLWRCICFDNSRLSTSLSRSWSVVSLSCHCAPELKSLRREARYLVAPLYHLHWLEFAYHFVDGEASLCKGCCVHCSI